MAEILSNSFKTDVTRLFIDDLANNDYYVFVSGIDTFAPEDSQFSKTEFLEKTLFGKKILSNDIHFMIKYYPWQVGQVYVEYDDTVNLADQRFYAVVGPNDNDTGDYRVFKCLNNNNGGADLTELYGTPPLRVHIPWGIRMGNGKYIAGGSEQTTFKRRPTTGKAWPRQKVSFTS